LLGLIAGIFLKAPPKGGPDRDPGRDRPGIELSAADRAAVRTLMHESFEAGREALEARRGYERRLAEVLKAEPYDETAARAALADLREADKVARDIVADRMFEGLGDLSPDQRELVAKLIGGNLEKRGKRHDRLEKFRERREGSPPPPPGAEEEMP